MVYQIYNQDRKNVLFDIEIYLKEYDGNFYGSDRNEDEKWVVELHSHAFISGAVDFIKSANNIDFEEFKKDCKELEELRGWLHEQHINSPRSMTEASRDKKEWLKDVANKIEMFAQKYGLSINRD